jgi:hypothetical protein
MLAPVARHLDQNGRYPNQDQRTGENNHRGGEHGVIVHHGASNDEAQPYTAARYPEHGYAPQSGAAVRYRHSPTRVDAPA